MKIIIASTIVPFVIGGGELIVDWLELKLKEYGHQVDVVKIPFSPNYQEVLTQTTALRLYHLENACDRLICIRSPSYVIPHPNKYLWFVHHYREIYDLWNTEFDSLPKNSETFAIREYIMRSDEKAFSEANKIYTNSKIVSKRLLDFNRIESKPLYPPILSPLQFYCDSYGDYIYYSSRIHKIKRQLLAVQAMRYTKTNVKLLVTGLADSQEYVAKLHKYIHSHSLEKKVTILNEWIPEEQKAKYFAKCLAAIYVPYDEDSYGYPSLEAHHSQKAVITCQDSGGTRELINDGENGWLVQADPKIIAEYFDRLYMDRKLAEDMGNKGFKRITELDITWDNVIRSFTQ